MIYIQTTFTVAVVRQKQVLFMTYSLQTTELSPKKHSYSLVSTGSMVLSFFKPFLDLFELKPHAYRSELESSAYKNQRRYRKAMQDSTELYKIP